MLSKVISGAENTVTYSALDAITWEDILKFESYVGGYNLEALSFVMSAPAKCALKSIAKVTNYPSFLCENNEVNGYPVNVSGAVENDNIYFGDWSKLILAQWGPGLDILIDPYTEARAGNVLIVGSMCADACVEQGAAFVLGKVQDSSSSSGSSN